MATTARCDSTATLMRIVVPLLRGSGLSTLFALIAVQILIVDVSHILAEDTPASSAVWNQCYRDRTLATAIAQAQDRLRTRATADGVSLLQWVLDQPVDGFIETTAGVISARMWAEQLLDSIPAAQYHLQFGASSDALFAKSKASEADLAAVVQRFFLTESGFAAAEQLIANWLDRGEYDLAAALLDRVLREPRHASRISARLRTLAEALRLEVAPRDGSSSPFLSARQRGTANRIGLTTTAADHLLESGWMVCGGDHCRNRVIVGSTPLLRPSWIAPAQSSRRQHDIETLLKNLEGRQRDLDRPVCAASFPIVVRDKVLFRNMTSCAQSISSMVKPSGHSPVDPVR